MTAPKTKPLTPQFRSSGAARSRGAKLRQEVVELKRAMSGATAPRHGQEKHGDFPWDLKKVQELWIL